MYCFRIGCSTVAREASSPFGATHTNNSSNFEAIRCLSLGFLARVPLFGGHLRALSPVVDRFFSAGFAILGGHGSGVRHAMHHQSDGCTYSQSEVEAVII